MAFKGIWKNQIALVHHCKGSRKDPDGLQGPVKSLQVFSFLQKEFLAWKSVWSWFPYPAPGDGGFRAGNCSLCC